MNWSAFPPNFNEPFQHPDLWFADLLRCVCVIMGAVLIGGVVAIAKNVKNTRQWGLYGFAIAALVAIGTECERMGKTVNWLLPLNFVFITFGLVFIYKTYQQGDHG